MMAMLVVWTDSLYAGMIFHSAYNASSILLDLLASGAVTEEAAAQAALMETDVIAAIGGAPAAVMLAVGRRADVPRAVLAGPAAAYARRRARGRARGAGLGALGARAAARAGAQARRLHAALLAAPSAGEIALLALAALAALGLYGLDLANMLGAAA